MNKNRGNVIFLILIAILLFAALSYAVTNSNRNSSGGSISKEKAKTYAGQIIQFGASLNQAVLRLKINGCTDYQLDFSSNGIYKRLNGTESNTVNSNAPSDRHCNVFDPAGGSVSPIIPPAEALDQNATLTATSVLPGHAQFRASQMRLIGTDAAAGTESANDLFIAIGLLKKDICVAINDILSVSNPSGAPPVLTITGTTNGLLTDGSLAANTISDGPEIDGHISYCALTSSGTYSFRYVLVAR